MIKSQSKTLKIEKLGYTFMTHNAALRIKHSNWHHKISPRSLMEYCIPTDYIRMLLSTLDEEFKSLADFSRV